ncbi:MAG: hypothetical protein QGH45_23115 [Myxococcota bacterium]|jgi:hypothetical protein|nr:hypothetical protein [Myxococcota bacterium]
MKKRPLSKTPDASYPSYAEARRQRPAWLQRLTIGAAILGASTFIACDNVKRVLGMDDACQLPVPGEAPVLIAPVVSGDDDDSATPAGDETTPADDEVRPEGNTRGRIAMPQPTEGS